MFARRVSMQLKPNSVPELTQSLEKEIIPLPDRARSGWCMMRPIKGRQIGNVGLNRHASRGPADLACLHERAPR